MERRAAAAAFIRERTSAIMARVIAEALAGDASSVDPARTRRLLTEYLERRVPSWLQALATSDEERERHHAPPANRSGGGRRRSSGRGPWNGCHWLPRDRAGAARARLRVRLFRGRALGGDRHAPPAGHGTAACDGRPWRGGLSPSYSASPSPSSSRRASLMPK